MTEEAKRETEVPVLTKIQMELKVPKSQWNKFGTYYYRSAEDIESSLKPLLEKYGCEMTIDDEPVMVGDWHYIKATVDLKTSDGKSYLAHGYAREELNKKGQDASQTSGSTSSYARKYALGGLFLIDDTKDADSYDNSEPKETSQAKAQKNNYNYKKDNEKKLLEYTVKFNGSKVPLASVYRTATDNSNELADKASKFIHELITAPQRKYDAVVIQKLTKDKLYLKAEELSGEPND